MQLLQKNSGFILLDLVLVECKLKISDVLKKTRVERDRRNQTCHYCVISKRLNLKRGVRVLFYKISFPIDYKTTDILKKNFEVRTPLGPAVTAPRGINEKKKAKIVKELLPFMPTEY